MVSVAKAVFLIACRAAMWKPPFRRDLDDGRSDFGKWHAFRGLLILHG